MVGSRAKAEAFAQHLSRERGSRQVQTAEPKSLPKVGDDTLEGRCLLLFGQIFIGTAALRLMVELPPQGPRAGRNYPAEDETYTDPATGATVRRLTSYPDVDDYHLYFTENGWYDDG